MSSSRPSALKDRPLNPHLKRGRLQGRGSSGRAELGKNPGFAPWGSPKGRLKTKKGPAPFPGGGLF